MRHFERNEEVIVQIGTTPVFTKGRVVFDSGGERIIIDRHNHPTKLSRVPRDRVRPKPPDEEAASVVIGTIKIACLPTEHGVCALQIQSRPLTRTECIAGVWTICATWAVSSTAPSTTEPTCKKCREYLGLS